MPMFGDWYGVKKEVGKLFCGIGGVKRELSKMYAGIGGVKREIFGGSGLYLTITGSGYDTVSVPGAYIPIAQVTIKSTGQIIKDPGEYQVKEGETLEFFAYGDMSSFSMGRITLNGNEVGDESAFPNARYSYYVQSNVSADFSRSFARTGLIAIKDNNHWGG